MGNECVYYEDLKKGDSASFAKTVSESDVYQFAGITGDFNELHINREAAEGSLFGARVVHGCLADSFVSTVLGMKLPGKGTIFLEKNVKYLKPVYIGDTVTATVTVAEIMERGRVSFDVSYTNQKGEEVISGTALVIAPRRG